MKKIAFCVIVGLILLLSGCTQVQDEEGNGDAESEMSFTEIRIQDKPSANFSHINVTFSTVKVHKSGEDNDSGWTGFTSDFKTIDLIYLHENNLSEQLGVTNLSVGRYTKLWIDVDSATGVLAETGEEITFDVPSGTLKIQQSFEIKEGNTTITVELDLEKSIHYNVNSGVAKLQPVIARMHQIHGDGSEDDIDIEDENLIAHWKFDETEGTVASDSAGNYNGTVIGEATWSTGYDGNALYFDGADDYVQLPQNAIDDIGSLTQGTIAFWFNYSSLLDTQTIMPIFFIGNQDTNDNDSIFIIEIGHSDTEAEGLTIDPENKNVYVTWTDWETDNLDPVLCYDTNENQPEDTWIHFAVVVGPDGNTGYLNGVELDNRRYNFGSSSDQMFLEEIPVNELFTIGYGKTHRQISPEFVYYKGYIDDLRIYNEPLSSDEINALVEQ